MSSDKLLEIQEECLAQTGVICYTPAPENKKVSKKYKHYFEQSSVSYCSDAKVDRKISTANQYSAQQRKTMHICQKVNRFL